MTARVTVAGSLNMDLVIRSPRIPRSGETIIGGEYQNVPGGKGANQTVAAARLGSQGVVDSPSLHLVRKYLSRIQDVQRIKCLLDPSLQRDHLGVKYQRQVLCPL